jgi:hypothetical protein
MADNKYSKQLDRQAVLHDYKRRIIDLLENGQALPDTGIYDEPVRYFKANEKWCKIIFGWLAWLEDVAGWPDAEDDNYLGIQAILTFEEGIDVPMPEFPTESDCDNYLLSAPFVSFYPQNPYNQPDYVPPYYLVPPFMVNDELEYPEIFGYLATDIFVPPAAINIDPIDLITLNLPRVEVKVRGSGQVEIDLLAVPLGGYLVTKVGSMPNIGDIIIGGVIETGVQIIDLNNDDVSIPPESNVLISEEFNIEAETPETITTIYMVFIPKIDDALIPLAFGGGIRQIGLCGFEGEGGLVGLEDIRFNSEICFLEKRIAGEWLPVEGWEDLAACLGVENMATKAEITEAIVDAWEIGASRFLSGDSENLKSGITIDTDFTKEYKAIETPDDPDTPEIDESRASAMGAAISVLKAIEKYLDRVDNYYGATNGSPATPQAEAILGLSLLFECDETLLNLGVDAYYTYRATNLRILYDGTDTHENYMYCKGANSLAWKNLLIELSGYTSAKIAIVVGLTNALLPAFWSKYYEEGLLILSTQYFDAPCVPIAPQTLTGLVFGTARPTTPLKSQHRMRIKPKGYAIDVDGDIQDAFWYKTAAGVLTRSNWSWVHGAGSNQPSDNQVVYNDAHEYDYTIDLAALNAVMTITPNKNAGMNATGLTYPIPFEVTLEDLGEYAV